MTDDEILLLKQMTQTVAAINRDLARLQGCEHAEHRCQIVKGVIDPALPATLEREERAGFDYASLIRAYGNGDSKVPDSHD